MYSKLAALSFSRLNFLSEIGEISLTLLKRITMQSVNRIPLKMQNVRAYWYHVAAQVKLNSKKNKI